MSSSERENAVCKNHKFVFISQIGLPLKSAELHDSRAPDYDDWELNGDILVWYDKLDRAIEVSSMGIRVNEASLIKQLEASGQQERSGLLYHKLLLRGKLPLTIGGGIG